MKLFTNWSYPTSIRFGAGRIKEIAEVCQQIGIAKPLLVTDKNLANNPITLRTLDILESEGLGRAIFSEVDPNPSDNHVEIGLQTYHAGNYDGVIAFGGGSALDLAKVIAFMVGQTRPIWDFEDVGDWWMRANVDTIQPIVAVPTTAGTGSEVGRAAIIINSQTTEKKIIFHPKMLASTVICDPELTLGMPPFITAGTGLDAFAHCVEAFSSPNYHPMSQGIALEGMRLVKENLLTAYHEASHLQARSHIMSAAMMGSVSFQKGLGAIHALSHPIGAIYHTHHGTTNAVCMPAVLQFNRDKIAHSFDSVAAYLNIDGGFEGFCDYVNHLNASLSIPRTLQGLGISDSDIDIEKIVKGALNDPSAHSNPVEMTFANTQSLLRQLL